MRPLYLVIPTYERVHRLEAGLHRLVHGLPGNNTRRLQFNSGARVGGDGTLSINRVAEGVDDTAEKAITDGHINDRASPLDDIAFLNFSVRYKKEQLATAFVL